MDVTDRKKMEEQLAQLQKTESLGRMAGAVAHHYNNLLQVVIGNLEMAMDDLPRNFHTYEEVENALRASRRAASLGGVMLTYIGESFARQERVDLCELCRESLPALKLNMPGTVALETDFPVPGPVVCQPYYNLLNRLPEVEILEACAHYRIGVVPYSPIARGVLSGKYLPGQKPAEGTRAARGDPRMMQTEFREESFVIAQQLKTHCEARGLSLSHFATAWVLANKAVSAVIAGPRTFEQWTDYFGALECTLTAEDEALVDSLVRPGHPSTPGYSDPAYPIAGR